MAAPADYLDAADLKAVLAGGLVREDVLDEIFDCSDIPTPFLDMIGTEGCENSYAEWTEDALPTPSLTNKVVSGSDRASADNDANVTNAKRVGNHLQISTKEIFVTTRGNAVNSIGGNSMGYQTGRRLNDLRRDVEAASLNNQASVQDDNNATAGQSAGAPAWITTNVNMGAGGVVGGFNTGTKLVAARTVGEGRGGTLANLGTLVEQVYTLGANVTVLMSIPGVIKQLAKFLFTTAFVAQPTANVTGTGGGVNQTSQGYIDMMKTDFGTILQLVPNRLQQPYADAAGGAAQTVGDLFGFDLRYWSLGLLYGWGLDVLGKQGLSDRKMAHVDWTLKCKLQRANFLYADLNPTTAWVA